MKKIIINDSENNKKENREETTKNGEFVASFFNWITTDHQKKRAEELNSMTDNNRNKK